MKINYNLHWYIKKLQLIGRNDKYFLRYGAALVNVRGEIEYTLHTITDILWLNLRKYK